MKRVLIVLTLALFTVTAQAQLFSKERIANDGSGGKGDIDARFLSWGYFLGFNQYDFKFEYNEEMGDQQTDILVEPQIGFNVGLIGDMKVSNHVNLRVEPGLYYTQRNLRFPNFEDEADALRETKSTYIHVPLLLKLSTARLNNFKPFIVGGLSFSYNLSSNQDNPDDNFRGQFRMKDFTNYFELGFGVDIYLYYFKFTPSIRGVFATSNEVVPDGEPNSPWTDNIASMSTRGVFINFTFQ